MKRNRYTQTVTLSFAKHCHHAPLAPDYMVIKRHFCIELNNAAEPAKALFA
ncbi:hypothetical protein [Corallincola luteus]|uniref:hypothetical protein n=1 Tax=Corallincola luteus TaxID=1775177 RepID=UPI0013F478AB|nr:hypothetical protein [Corallincola luteus]